MGFLLDVSAKPMEKKGELKEKDSNTNFVITNFNHEMGNLLVNLGRPKNPHSEKTKNDFCKNKRIWIEIWQKAIYVNLQKKI